MVETRSATPEVRTTPERTYNDAIGYLRAFITLLVLAHHGMLAYHPYAPPPPQTLLSVPRWWQAFPVVDSQKWAGSALLVGFNDTFFMSLMFFLSGLFVWNSLRRKSAGTFLRDRVLRLGLPFLLSAAFIAPLAYYPAFLQTGAKTGLSGFWSQWRALGNWPAGPAWFVWVLLAFDIVAALLFWCLPAWGEVLGRWISTVSSRPFAFFALLVAVSAAVYLPMELAFNSMEWSTFGPFTFQTSRILHYFVYFLIAVGIGACGVSRGLLAPDGKLARRWLLWSIAAIVIFGITITIVILAITTHIGSKPWEALGDIAFALSCAASSFALLALFIRFARTRRPVFDSLRDSAYGMYLVHYAFVSWLQYALVGSSLPGFAKASLVFLGTVALSWGTIAAMRRVPAIARVI